MNIGDWTERFDGTRALPREVRDMLLSQAHVMRIEKGKSVFNPSSIPNSLLFLIDGTVRVVQSSEGGREIVLYRVEAGQSCVLTTACMLAEEAYNAEGIAETDVTAVSLSRTAFDKLVAEEESFRKFVFAAYSRRLIDLLRVVDDVAFGRVDVRLAGRLLALSGGSDELATTHQSLAAELGTAREVISRVLQDFQRRGLVSQTRGKITLEDREKLEKLAEHE